MRKFLSLFAAVLVAFVANAAVINISNTTADALRLALNNAGNGDVIEMAAGTYVESNTNYIAFAGKNVTVRAAKDAEVIIQPQVPFTLAGGATARFENIKFDASRLSELATWYEHLLYPDDANENNLVLEGCEFYGFNINKSMIYCSSANRLASVSINNCYFHDCMKSLLFVENTTAMNVQITNSTFANIATDASSYYAAPIDVRATGSTFRVDHCTFYNVLCMNTDYSAVSKVTFTDGEVSNCIFMLPTAQNGIRAMRGVKANNCITFNYLNDSGTGIHSSVTKNNCVQQDPLFTDASANNFTLGTGSPALTMNDGAAIGDPRWVAEGETVEQNVKTIYCKNVQSWWKVDGAAVGAYAWKGDTKNAEWPGVRMTAVEGETDLWSIELDMSKYENVIFTRVNASGDIADWGAKTKDLTIPTDDKNLFTITTTTEVWGDPGVDGTWSKYEASEPVEPTLANGFYLIGQKGWDVTALTADLKFELNEGVEYKLTATLTEGEGIKVVKVENDAIVAWYPDGMGNEYKVDAAHAGADKDIYFQETYKEDWAAFGGYFWTGENTVPVVDTDQMYVWNGNGVTKAADAIELGGAAEAIQTSGSNMIVGASQKGNWCWKANKGFSKGEYYIGIALDNAVNAGDTIKVAYFRTGSSASFVMGMDFNADKASVATTYQILTTGDPQVLASNGVPADSIYIVPEGVKDAKYIRVYRNTGSTGLWISKFEIAKKVAGETPVDPAKFYITGDAATVGEDMEWNPAAIKVTEDSYTLALAAGDYKLKVTLDGTWTDGQVKGFADLTQEDKAGLTGDADGNICFTLAEAGNVVVAYSAEAFTVTGNFYVAPVEDPAKFYITGDAATVGEDMEWNPAAIKVTEDSYTLALAAGDYKLKVTLDGTWTDGQVKGFADLTQEDKAGLTGDADGNICFTLAEAGNVVVAYSAEAFTVTGNFYVAPALENGFYLVGSMNDWQAKAAYKFAANEENEGEYQFTTTLAENDQFKVVKVEGETQTWYPDGMDNNYVVDAAHAGEKTVYFRPDGQGGEDWHHGCIFVAANDGPIAGCDWESIEFLGTTDNTYANQFKICKEGDVPGVVNIQKPGFAEEIGIYVTFPNAVLSDISLAEGQYAIQGAGIVLYLSAFTAVETEVSVVCDGNTYTFTVYNAKGETPQPVHTYTVAGSSAVAFGSEWDQTDAKNDMVAQADGTYKWEKAELTLPAGTIEFKVVEDHAWAVAYPSSNYQLAIEEAGVYTITITFDATTEEVQAVATKTGSAEVDPTVSIKGSWDEWAEAVTFTLAEDKLTATASKTLEAGSYQFKVILNGGEWRSNGYTYHREFTGAEDITGNEEANMILEADKTGTFVFTWTFATNALNITFPVGSGLINAEDGIQAVKVLRDGQLLIMKGDKTYNVMGALVR